MQLPEVPIRTDIANARLEDLNLSSVVDIRGKLPCLFLLLDVLPSRPPRPSDSSPENPLFPLTDLYLDDPMDRECRGDMTAATSIRIDVCVPMENRMVQRGHRANDVSEAMVADTATIGTNGVSVVTAAGGSSATVSGMFTATATDAGAGTGMV